jgi:hypothetical protein
VYNAWYDKQIGAQQSLVLVVWAPETASQSARAEALLKGLGSNRRP